MSPPNPPKTSPPRPRPILYTRARRTTPRARLLRLLARAGLVGLLASALTGCASAARLAPDSAAPSPPPKPAPEDNTSRTQQTPAHDVPADDVPAEAEPARRPDPNPSPDPAPSPSRDSEAVTVESSGGGWFEGDTFDDSDTSPHAQVAALVESIEGLNRANTTPQPQDHLSGPQAACSDVCQAQDAICASSAKICTIAQRNPQEPYFAERCTWSRGACTQAQARCAACTP